MTTDIFFGLENCCK